MRRQFTWYSTKGIFRLGCIALVLFSSLATAQAHTEDSSLLEFDPLADGEQALHHHIDTGGKAIIGSSVLGFTLAREFDPAARDYFNGQNRIGGLSHLGNDFLGTGVPGILAGAGLWIYGAESRSPYEFHAGIASLESLFETFVLTSVLKITVQRTRPDGSNTASFPSGHTSTVAASSMVLAEFYGWRAAVPAFLLTALTGASRMGADKHWLSDTVAGAALGVWSGYAVSRSHLERLEPRRESGCWELAPQIWSSGAALVFSAEFP